MSSVAHRLCVLLALLPLCLFILIIRTDAGATPSSNDRDFADGTASSAGNALSVCCGHRRHGFACKEMVRYLYLTTGYLPTMEKMYEEEEGISDLAREDAELAGKSPGIPARCRQDAIILMEKDHPYSKFLAEDVRADIEVLRVEEHHTRLAQWELQFAGVKTNVLLVIGGSHEGVKHGTYELLERYGVAFRIEGDITPRLSSWSKVPQPLLNIKTTGSPTFDVRGLQPFHDFPEGPDWWGQNQYKAIFSQLSKMRMNFLGLHTYPYSPTPGTGRDEPTVWVGLKEDVNADGSVKTSYPTSYANTMRNQWADSNLSTSLYHYGAKDLFPTDCYGSEVQVGNCPLPTTMEGNNEVFAKTGDMLKGAFEHAHRLSMQTCVGTETPLSKPAPSSGIGPLNLYYSASRKDHFLTTTQCAECENVYTFVGIEGFISLSPQAGLVPIYTYFNGHLLDNVLTTKAIEGYSMVRIEGYVNAFQFERLSGQDADMDSLQIFFNAKASDHLVAANPTTKQYALANGYILQSTVAMVMSNSSYKAPTTQDYYEGIFTRIMNLGMPIDYYWIWTPEGWEWGKMTENNTVFQEAVSDLKAALAARDAVKAPFELATCGWVVGPLPDRSIFDKVLPSEYSAITSIDMQVGNTPVDKSYMNITLHKKWAIPWMEDDPGLTAPELWVNRTLEHMEDAAKYGCNGLLGIHWRTKQTSPQIAAMGMKSWNPTLTSDGFWAMWSKSEFGFEDAAPIFSSVDSFKLPRPVSWSGGPGGWRADGKQCSQGSAYAFVDELDALRAKVNGSSNLDRFDYWLNSFLYMRGIAATECAWAMYDSAVAAANKIKDATQRAAYAKSTVLPARIELVANATQTISYLLSTVVSPGEMGTVMNVLSHSLVHAIDEQTAALEAMLKPVMSSLPPNAMPSDAYTGPDRLIVPTARSELTGGENLVVTAMVLVNGSPQQPCTVTLNWRPLASPSYATVAMTSVGRQVYEGQLSLAKPPAGTMYDYYVSAKCSGKELVWPSGAPTDAIQTLVVD